VLRESDFEIGKNSIAGEFNRNMKNAELFLVALMVLASGLLAVDENLKLVEHWK